MKRNVYYIVIAIGVVLFILGLAIPGFPWFWGLLVAAVAAITMVVNTQNQKRVAERLAEEKDMFRRNEAAKAEAQKGEQKGEEKKD